YECNGGFSPSKGQGSYAFVDNETWIHTLTEAQYNSLQDPLAYILLSNTSPPDGGPCGNGGATCYMSQDGGSVNFGSRMFVTAVPTPEPLSLLLLGFVGLALSRLRRQWTVASLAPAP